MGTNFRYSGLSSEESESRFRAIFLSHLESEGYSRADAFRLIFKTPATHQHPPGEEQGLDLISSFREHYRNQLPHSWYFEGLHRDTAPVAKAVARQAKPVTFIVIPGIFGEFIDQLPFQAVLDDQESPYTLKWASSLEEAKDQTFSLLDMEDEPRSLAQLVKTGSLMEGDHTLCHVLVLKAESGSLETLGTLESNAAVYRRRLERLFEVIDADTDIYLIGYSRGLAVALELVSSLHEENKAGTLSPANRSWFENLKGVVGLGGVFYGAQFAQDVLEGQAGETSDMVTRLCHTVESLQTVPEGSGLKEKREIAKSNLKAWTALMKKMSDAEDNDVARGKSFLECDLQEAYSTELKSRLRSHKVSSPNATGILGMATGFLKKTFHLTGTVAGYNRNILALKHLVQEMITGLHSLTPETRDAWWRTHELPENLALFSITGIMPDMGLHGFQSPLLDFVGFGPKSTDFNAVLRSNYYDTSVSENTQINDSQMSHFGSRYWEQIYPQHRYAHFYLGILGTHHWGMGFPYAVKDHHTNSFPRATLLRSIAVFISSLDQEDGHPDGS